MPLLSELLFTLFTFGWMIIFTSQLFACGTRKPSSREERKDQSRMKPTSRRSAQSRKKSVSKSNIRRGSKKDAGKEKKEAGDGEKHDDSFEDRVPVTRECKRAQEEPQIAKKTKDNKRDYKTWNKVIENEDFDAPLNDPNSEPVKKANAQVTEKTATPSKDDKTKK